MASYKKSITLGLDIDEFEKNAQKAQDEIKDIGNACENTSANIEGTSSASDNLGGSFTNVVDVAQTMGDVLKASTEALASVKAAMEDCLDVGVEYATNLEKISSATGWSTDAVQQWQYVAEQSDTSISTIESAYTKMEKQMLKAESGSKTASAAFAKLGVSVTDSSGQMRDGETVFLDVIDALSKMDNQTEQSQTALTLLGTSANDMSEIIDMSKDEILDLGDDLEGMLTEDEIEALASYDDAMQSMNTTVTLAKAKIATALAPTLTALVELFADLDPNVIAVVGTLVTLTTTVIAVGTAVKSASALITVASSAMTAFGVSSSVALGPVLLITAAITALVVALAAALGLYKDYEDIKSQYPDASSGQIWGAMFSNDTSKLTGHNASGTQRWRGGLTWVGEEGPEIVDVPYGSKIYNNSESNQITGGNTYNISMNCDLTKMKSVSDVIDAVSGLSNSSRSYA